MFAKPYKLKSNNTLKNSEKKHLATRILQEFPAATEERTKELISAKSTTICLKLVLHSGDVVSVYVVDAVPCMMDVQGVLVPTVAALWKVPELLTEITIHSPVLAKLQGGAPLYLPGVAIPPQGVGFPLFARGTLLALRTEDNAAACAVGRAVLSSADMLLRVGGVCFEPLHILGDQLCREARCTKLERPTAGHGAPTTRHSGLGLAHDFSTLSVTSAPEPWPALGRSAPPPAPAPPPPPSPAPAPAPAPASAPASAPHAPRVIAAQGEGAPDGVTAHVTSDNDSSLPADSEHSVPTDMDDLLRYCLLSFIKLEGKRTELPLKTSLLYRKHMVPLCPAPLSLDVKKSTYKKMSKFLDQMQKEGLVEVREVSAGVDAVVAVSLQHPALRGHVPAPPAPAHPPAPGHPPAPAAQYAPPAVSERHCVTAAVLGLFVPHKKGTALTPSEVRASLTEYVKLRSLDAQQRGAVILDTALAHIMGKSDQESIKWEELMSAVLSKMTPCTEMRYSDGQVTLHKSRLEPVRMQVATRSGNKKVTLVSNLEQFGFNLPELAKACQLGVAASCGVTRAPGAKADQLCVQGDQLNKRSEYHAAWEQGPATGIHRMRRWHNANQSYYSLLVYSLLVNITVSLGFVNKLH